MRSLLPLIAAVLWPTWVGAADSSEAARVAVRVNITGEDSEFVYVSHRNGEPVVVTLQLAERGYFGASLLELTPGLRSHFGAPEDAGVMVSRVDPEGPAARAGLLAGDLIVAIDGQAVRDSASLAAAVSRSPGGQMVSVDGLRAGEPMKIEVTLEERRRPQLDLGGLIATPEPGGETPRGVVVTAPPIRVELDPEAMSRALALMREHFESPEWRNGPARSGAGDPALEGRIRELEHRLRELERELREIER